MSPRDTFGGEPRHDDVAVRLAPIDSSPDEWDDLFEMYRQRLERVQWLRERHQDELSQAGLRVIDHVIESTRRDLDALAAARSSSDEEPGDGYDATLLEEEQWVEQDASAGLVWTRLAQVALGAAGGTIGFLITWVPGVTLF